MPCTTILVGKNAAYDGSTMIARTDDGHFDVKKLIVVTPDKQPREYTCVRSRLTIQLPNNPLRYTSTPNVDPKNGVWAANGINEANVGMTATETISSNPRVMGADQMVNYHKEDGKDVPGGIGEEDILVLVLPYIRTAREGVLRLGSLLEQYGTYECNGIAFNDADEIWWLETIGGHHWIARRVGDEECVVMPNQFGLDRFDFDDACGEGRSNLCSPGLKEFVEEHFLYLGKDDKFNPRLAFGSCIDFDHAYNTPRAWFAGRYLCPTKYKWEGANADFTPESDNIPWAFVPERKVTVEDVKYLLSSYYQGTHYNPYSSASEYGGKYRPIGISRTGVMALCQIRGYLPVEVQAVEWICFGSTSFDAFLPLYANVNTIPAYLSDVEMSPSTDNFYWNCRLIGAIADAHYAATIMQIERYQNAVPNQAYRILNEYDAKVSETKDVSLLEEANERLAEMAKKETGKCLKSVIRVAYDHMKNGYNRSDN